MAWLFLWSAVAVDSGGGWAIYTRPSPITLEHIPVYGLVTVVSVIGHIIAISLGVAIGMTFALWYYDRHIQ